MQITQLARMEAIAVCISLPCHNVKPTCEVDLYFTNTSIDIVCPNICCFEAMGVLCHLTKACMFTTQHVPDL